MILAGMGLTVSGEAETLEEALVSTYTSNATLLAQRAQTRATDEQVPQALANWRPTVKLSADAGETQQNSNLFLPLQPYAESLFARDYGLTVSQPLYRGGRTDAQVEQADANVNAQRQQLASTEQTVLLAAVTAYMDVLQDEAVVQLEKNDEQVLQRQLDSTNDRFRVGEVTRTDVAQAQAALSGAHAARRAAEADLRSTAAAYVTVIGHPPRGLKEPGPVAGLPGTLAEAQAQAARNPSVLAQHYAVESADHGVDLAEGELLPQVSLNASYGHEYEEFFSHSYVSDAQALVNVTVPIYQQGAEYSRLREQKHTAGEQRIKLDETQREAVESSTRAWETLQAARARMLSYRDQIKASETALEGVKRESLVGSRTVLDVLNAEQDLLNARVNLVRARHDAQVAAYQLRGSVGGLTVQALKLPVAAYDPAQHYNEVRDQWMGGDISPSYGEVGK